MASTKPTATSPAPATRKTRADLNLVPGETAPSGPSETRAPDAEKAFRDCAEYIRDVGERSVLFWDTLRARAENIIAHDRAGKPPLLDFDPRAGHGPGIGGFKRDSEVGLALRAGHPVYFVAFAPEPLPGQALDDVLHTLRHFVEEVATRHPGMAPVLYGNCQAGWAITILAADCAGLVGPAVLNGSPLSYWAGEAGVNLMRIAGGLVGGAWLTHLLADLGGGRFDGAWLVQNF